MGSTFRFRVKRLKVISGQAEQRVSAEETAHRGGQQAVGGNDQIQQGPDPGRAVPQRKAKVLQAKRRKQSNKRKIPSDGQQDDAVLPTAERLQPKV